MEEVNMNPTTLQLNNHTGRIPKTFLGLQKKFYELRPIHNKDDYEHAMETAEELSLRSDLTSEQADYLEVLTTIIAEYENKHIEMQKHPKPPPKKFLPHALPIIATRRVLSLHRKTKTHAHQRNQQSPHPHDQTSICSNTMHHLPVRRMLR